MKRKKKVCKDCPSLEMEKEIKELKKELEQERRNNGKK